MDGFKRAYRDSRSPLTPLTPLSHNNVFSFRMGGDDSLKPWIDQIDAKRRKRDISPQPGQRALPYDVAARQHVGPAAPHPKLVAPVGFKQRARDKPQKAHPVGGKEKCQQLAVPCLAVPRLALLLARVGMQKYLNLFQRERIDFEAFRTLTWSDLIKLGVRSQNDIKCLLKAIQMANV